MNKVILMGRLTREPDVRYSQNADGSMAVARYTLAVDRRRARNIMMSSQLILSVVLLSVDLENLLKSIFIRELRLLLQDVSRQVVILIRMDRESTLLMLLLKNRNLLKVNPLRQVRQQHIHHQDQNQALLLGMDL